MTPLDQDQQKYYVHRRSGISDSKIVAEFFENVNIIDNSEYFGIPLQLYILTDIFNRNGDLKNIVTLTDMCQHFIDGKYTHFLKKNNIDDDSLGGLIENAKKHRLEQYQIAALKTYLPDLKLQKHNTTDFIQQIKSKDILGLIVKISENGMFEFEHNIFGHYLCALWLSENLNQLDSFLFDVQHRNIKFMFDLILAEKRPVFISILYKKFEDLDKYDIVKDNGGRSPLHVICTYGKEHALVQTGKCDRYFDEETVIEDDLDQDDDEDFKKAVLYLKSKCNVCEKDDLFRWTPYEYADRSLSLGLMEILSGPLNTVLPTLQNYKHSETVLFYSTKNNYTNLFNAVKDTKYFEYKTLGNNLLHVSSEFGREDFLTWLLQNEEYVKFINRSDNRKWTPLHSASSNGHLNILKFLKEKGATFRLSRPSTLSLATKHKYQQVLEFLVECDLSLNEFYHDNYLTQSLSLAVSRGYTEIVNFFVSNGVKLHGIGKNSMNALQLALAEGQIEIAKLFLHKGLNIDGVDTNGMNCYHQAAMDNRKPVVEFLLEQKANFRILDKRHRSPLHYAAQNGSFEIAELLIDKGIEINNKDDLGLTPMHLACQYGQVRIMEQLIEAGSEVNLVDKYGRTPMHHAAINGVAEGIEILFQNKASIETEDLLYKRRPLHFAAWNGHDDCVEVLLKKGAVVDAACNFGYTPLHLAVEDDSFECCQLLVKNGASVFIKNRNGSTPLNLVGWNYAICSLLLKHYQYQTPLHLAVKEGKGEVLSELLGMGYDINELDENGATPLHVAVMRANTLPIIHTLLDKGADVTMADGDGYIPLHYALQSSKVEKEYVEVLLNADVENLTINKKTNKGLTPLHIGSQAGFHLMYPCFEEISLELVRLLLNKGAIVDVVDDEGFTPLHYAARGGNLEILKLLVSKGLRLDQVNKHGRTVLHMAATQNFLPIVTYLLSQNASVSAVDEDGDTPMNDALKSEHPRVYKELLGSNISKSTLEATNHKNRTILHMAAKQNFTDLIQLCLANHVSLDMIDSLGNTSIDDAFFSRHFDTFKLLLEHTNNYDINKYNHCHKVHLLHFAVSCRDEKMVQFLLERNAKVDVEDDHGNTPLHYAVENRGRGILEVVLDHDPGIIDKSNKSGETALHFAVKYKFTSEVKILLEKGARVDVKDNEGNIPFDLCVLNDSMLNVKELYQSLDDFDVNKKTRSCRTLLHYAVHSEDLELAKWLIKKGFTDINSVDMDGRTPLHLACENEDMVRLLMEAYGSSIDFTIRSNNNETVLDHAWHLPIDLVKTMIEKGAFTDDATTPAETYLYYAFSSKNTELFRFFMDKYPSVDVSNMINDNGDTVLHVAASKGDHELVKCLLGKGAKIHSVNRRGDTPVTKAAYKGHLKVLEVLLDEDKKKEVVNMANSQGRTLLHEVAEDGKLELVKLLVEKGARVDLRDNDGKTAAELAWDAEENKVYAYLVDVNVHVVGFFQMIKTVKREFFDN